MAEVTFESHCMAASLFGQRHVQDSILAIFQYNKRKAQISTTITSDMISIAHKEDSYTLLESSTS